MRSTPRGKELVRLTPELCKFGDWLGHHRDVKRVSLNPSTNTLRRTLSRAAESVKTRARSFRKEKDRGHRERRMENAKVCRVYIAAGSEPSRLPWRAVGGKVGGHGVPDDGLVVLSRFEECLQVA